MTSTRSVVTPRRRRRYGVPLVLAAVALLLVCCLTTATTSALALASSSSSPSAPATVTAAKKLTRLTSRAALAAAISCQFTPRPTLVLFTPQQQPSTASSSRTARAIAEASRAAVANLTDTELLPAGVLAAAYEFQWSLSAEGDAAFLQFLSPVGQDHRRPVLAIFCAGMESGFGLPGIGAVPFPSFVPSFYIDSEAHVRRRQALQTAAAGGGGGNKDGGGGSSDIASVATAAATAEEDKETAAVLLRRPPLTDTAGVRHWLLSQTAARYADRVTLAMLPAVYTALSVAEAHTALADIAGWATAAAQGTDGGLGGARGTRTPAVVVTAYVRLSTSGSEEVVAALHATAVQRGGAVAVVAVESAEVAAVFGLHAVNTARVVFSDGSVGGDGGGGSSPSPSSSSASGAALAALVAAIGDVATAPTAATAAAAQAALLTLIEAAGPAAAIPSLLTAGAYMQEATAGIDAVSSAADTATPGQTAALAAWQSALTAVASGGHNPLRQITTDTELQQALRTNSGKLLFFLRESDAVFFPQHRKLVAEVAARLQRGQVVPYATRRGVHRSFRPTFAIDVYWIDAERHPAVASRLRQSAVPSAVFAFPVLSKEDEARRQAALVAGRPPEVFMDAQGLHGFHTVNHHDLSVVEEGVESASPSASGYTQRGNTPPPPPPPPPERKEDLKPQFPSSADALLRLLAGPNFIARIQFAMMPLEAATLTLGGGGGSISGGERNSNFRIDHRYYPKTPAEMEAPRYLSSVFTGALQLPDASSPSTTTGTTGSGDGASQADKARAAAAKASWAEQLVQRRSDKERRVREKAAADEALRLQRRAEMKDEVVRSVLGKEDGDGDHANNEDGKGRRQPGAGAGVPSSSSAAAQPDREARLPGGAPVWGRVRRPGGGGAGTGTGTTTTERRRKALADATAWRDESRRLALDYVFQLQNGRISLFPGLEAPSDRG